MPTGEVFGALPLGDALLRILAALLIGALVGLEREMVGRPAGIRTHALVALGAVMFTMMSIGLSGPKADPGRIAAQIVVGIGFLGAGTIMRHGSFVQGLTTAASIWVSAAIGMACGMAWYPIAAIGGAAAFFLLAVVRPLARKLRPSGHVITMQVRFRPEVLGLAALVDHLQGLGGTIHNMDCHPGGKTKVDRAAMYLSLPPTATLEQVVATIQDLEGIVDVEAEEVE